MTMELVRGTCHHDCPDTCGWVATVEDGVAVKLRGASDHPYSQGELCPKVNRFLDRVYHDDRILHPLVRTGPKGSGKFEQVSWAEALSVVAERLQAVIAKHGGEAILPWWDAGTQGLIQMSSLDRIFFARLGATRLSGSLCGATSEHGLTSTYGSGLSADPMDVRFAKLVVLWGTNTRLTNRHLWPFVDEARREGAQLVVIDPIRTMTAETADLFIQPLPGTDVALMLAMMHVLVRDGLVDSDYVSRYAVGYEALADHVASWTPARAADVCGLSALQIETFAQLYGTTRPSMIRTLIGAEHHENGAMFYRSLGCLPVLTGDWRFRGGGLAANGTWAWFGDLIDESGFELPVSTRDINMSHLGRALTDSDVGIHALFVWNGNPVVSAPNSRLVRQGMAREDLFTVVSEQFMTDTARFADVVFPATTQLEQLDVVASWGHMYLGWNQPAIAPLGEAVPNTELWRRLAAAMGLDDPVFGYDDEALIRLALPGIDVDELAKKTWIRLNFPEPYLPFAEGRFATASGKAQLWSDELEQQGYGGLPEYRAPTEKPGPHNGSFPLSLLTPKNHTRFLNSSYSHHHGRQETGPYVELDPADAAARGIEEADQVRIWNHRGELSMAAHLSNRLRPGLVAVPWGWWGEAANVNILTNDTLADWGGGVAFYDTTVEVAKVSVGG